MRPRPLLWTLGEQRYGEDLTPPTVESCLLSGECGEGRRDPRDSGHSHSPAAPGALGPGCGRLCSRPNELSCWLRDQSPQGPQVPSFLSSPLPHLIHLRLRAAPPPPGRLPACAVSCKFLCLSAYPACGALYREPLEAGPPMGPQPPCPLTRTCGNGDTPWRAAWRWCSSSCSPGSALGFGGLGAPRGLHSPGPEGRR